MKNLAVYENLDTSFVNLSALVRFLRGKNFSGKVSVEFDGYEAEIELKEGGEINAREHDRIAGRIAEGEDAFQRLLIRARAPGGKIGVYQQVKETAEQKMPAVSANENPVVRSGFQKQTPAENNFVNGEPKPAERIIKIQEQSALPNTNPPPLPLEFCNRVEERARKTQSVTPEDWQTLLQLISELLGTIDKTLASAGLDFQTAFAKACAEIAGDYPFFKASAGAFSYSSGGEIILPPESVNAKILVAGINESLRRILEKLRADPKFEVVYRETAQAILALIHRRKLLYDKFFVTPQLEKSLGI